MNRRYHDPRAGLSLGGCCRYLLGTGEFVSGFLNGLAWVSTFCRPSFS